MKISHDYFQTYNTRKVQRKQATGLFMINGEPLPRDIIEDETRTKELVKKCTESVRLYPSQLIYSPGEGDISPLKRHLRETKMNNSTFSPRGRSYSQIANTLPNNSHTALRDGAYSPPRNVLNEAARLEAVRTSTPLYKHVATEKLPFSKNYTSRLQTPGNEGIKDHIKAYRDARKQFYTHIYHDNNFVQIHDEQKIVHTAERLWNPREKNIKALQNSWTSDCTTEVPNNKKALGLTPLRMNGHGQDKPHHVPKSHNTERFNTSQVERGKGVVV